MIRPATSRLCTALATCLVLVAAPLRADEGCSVPMADWQPRASVEAMAVAQGWRVSRIRLDDGCYEVTGQDADGRWIEAKLDPATLQIVEMEFEGNGHGSASRDGNDD